MEFNEYQEKAKGFAKYPMAECKEPNSRFTNLMGWTYPALGLAEESGEVCGKLAKALRDNFGHLSEERKEEIMKELGDVLWELSALAGELQIKLDDVASLNIKKLTDRKNRNVISGEGDNR